jgi:hypothetical protein
MIRYHLIETLSTGKGQLAEEREEKRDLLFWISGLNQGCQIFLGATHQNWEKYTKKTSKYSK